MADDLFRKDARPRAEWAALEKQGLCVECGQRQCVNSCRKKLFDWAYSTGYHDGANNMERHKWAFVTEMMDSGYYQNDEDA